MEQGAAIIVTIDGDGQHDPEDIPRAMDRLLQGDGVEVALPFREQDFQQVAVRVQLGL